MIDIKARQKVYDRLRQKQDFDNLAASFQKSIIDNKPEVNVNLDNTDVVTNINKIGIIMAMVLKAVSKPFPKLFDVNVKETPPVSIDNLSDLSSYFDSLEGQIIKLNDAIRSMPTPQVNVPDIKIPEIKVPQIVVPKADPIKIPEIKSPTVNIDVSGVIRAIEDLKRFIPIKDIEKTLDTPTVDNGLKEALTGLSEAISSFNNKDFSFPKKMDIGNFPRQMVPQPVTNININALNGVFKATMVTVGVSAVLLPATSLTNRRAVTVFNNDSSNPIYLGSATVTTLTGLPVLAQTYSPIFDAGVNMNLYGIAGGNVNVRVLEISNDNIGR